METTISKDQYESIVSRIERCEAARKTFDPKRFERGGGYSPEEIAEIDRLAGCAHPSNDELADVELYRWHHEKPERVFAYWRDDAAHGSTIVNWTGRVLGTVVRAGQKYRGTFGDARRNVRVQGTNGKTYAGTCYMTSGTYCRLREVKGA